MACIGLAPISLLPRLPRGGPTESPPTGSSRRESSFSCLPLLGGASNGGSAGKGTSDSDGRSSSWSSLSTTTILITAQPGHVIKSVRYDSKERLSKGQHKSLHLRVPSREEADAWADAIREAMTVSGGV